MTLAAALATQAALRPDQPALLGLADWGTFHARVTAAAARFAPLRGQVVAFWLPDGPELATLLVACMASGAIAFPLPASAPAPERERLLAGLKVGALVGPDDAGIYLAPGASLFVPGAPEAIALLVGTSGTTGRPKRVALSQAALLWNARAHARSLGLPDGVRSLVLSPLYHAFPLVAVVLGTLLAGGALAWPRGVFTPRSFLKEVASHGIGYAALPPTLLTLMMERLERPVGLPGVLSVGAAPMAPEALARAVRWADRGASRLYHTYGLSEAGPRVSTLGPEEALVRPGSVGRPLPGVSVRILSDGAECPCGTTGEVRLKSPSLMAGYYPELEGLSEDGWLPTGDLGWLDEAGYLHLRGRAKDVIVTGGVSVAAAEIEEALLAHPAVAVAAVVPQADATYGEVPRAHVVLREALSPEALMSHLMSRLSRHKLPHVIRIEEALPTTAVGKVDKRQLKETP